ncbi:hypothetical protein Pfo_001007 [Paulownia fortunei]|nr:hypothetical protein Pfo_001007 [Paulownia fortunei]
MMWRRSHRKRRIHSQHDHQTVGKSNSSSYSAELVGSNEDLLNIILPKLRIKYRVRCKIICKSWYRVITGHRFIYKLPPPSHLLIRRYTRRTGPSLFPEIKYLTVPLNTVRPLPQISQPFLHFLESNHLHVNGIRVSQSCNGLFLCPADIAIKKSNNVFCSHASNANVEHYVYNPTTNKTRFIPLPSRGNTRQVTAMNLAFDPSNSPHYKVVSLSRVHKNYVSYTQVDIYSSETWCWSVSKADFPRDCAHVDFSNGVFLNGAIHWPSYTGDTSVYFDVDNECFKIMPMPPVQDGQSRRTIRFFGESGGWLLLIDFHEPFTMKFVVFGMENDYSNWSVKYHVNFSLHAWIIDKLHILSVICGNDEDDLSLVIYIPGKDKAGKGLMTYNLRERILEKVHSPVPGWDLRLLEEKGSSVVHPLIRTRFAV